MASHDRRLVLPSYLAMLGVGMSNSLPGVLLPLLAPGLGLSAGDIATLVSITFVGIALLMLVTHHLTAWFGRKRLLLADILLQSAGALVLATAGSKAMAAAGVVLLGVGFGLQGSMLNGLFTRLYADSPAKIGGLNSLFGLGGLILPALIFGLVQVGLPGTWVIYSAMLVNGLAFLLYLPARLPAEESAAPGAVKVRLDWRLAFWILLYFTFYGGVETTMGQLLPTFLTESGRATASVGALAAGFYWGTLALGRMILGPVVSALGSRRFLLAGSGLALAAGLALVASPGPVAAFVIPVLFGLSIAMLWPTGIVIARQRLPIPAQQTVGMIAFATSTGCLVVPNMAGWLAGSTGPNSIVLVIALSLLILLITIPLFTTAAQARRA